MNDPRPVVGIVTAVNGTSPGPSSGITYTLMVSDPATAGAFPMEGQRPFRRWPDELDVVAFDLGFPVDGVCIGGEIIWKDIELPAFADCPAGLTEQQRLALLTGGGLAALIPSGPGFSETIPGGPPDTNPIPPAEM